MCVIIVKPFNADAPSIRTLKMAMDANPDGFSIAWCKRGKLEIYRTLSRDEMEKYYIEHFNELDKTAFVFHARWATHGTKVIDNCHGWTCLNGKMAFFHNGILNIKARGNMTDSETFLRDIYEPIASKSGTSQADRAISAIIGSSKFAFIGRNGAVKMYGDYTERGGCYYSNLRFMWESECGRMQRNYNPFIFANPHYYKK